MHSAAPCRRRALAIPSVDITVSLLHQRDQPPVAHGWKPGYQQRLRSSLADRRTGFRSPYLRVLATPDALHHPVDGLCRDGRRRYRAHLNTAVSSGSSPAPNVYQGVVNGNSVIFHGIPVLVPGATGSRVFRITNVRVSAQYLAGRSERLAGSGVALDQWRHFDADLRTRLSSSASSAMASRPAPAVPPPSASAAARPRLRSTLLHLPRTSAPRSRPGFSLRPILSYAGQISSPMQYIPGADLQLRIQLRAPHRRYQRRWFDRLRNPSESDFQRCAVRRAYLRVDFEREQQRSCRYRPRTRSAVRRVMQTRRRMSVTPARKR